MQTINSKKSLLVYKVQIQEKLSQNETQLNEDWDYLKLNYKSLIWGQVNPFKHSLTVKNVLSFIDPAAISIISGMLMNKESGETINVKAVGNALKYLVGMVGLKWLKKWLRKEQSSTAESNAQTNSYIPEDTA